MPFGNPVQTQRKLTPGGLGGDRAVQPGIHSVVVQPRHVAAASSPDAVVTPLPLFFDGMARMGDSRLLFYEAGTGTGLTIPPYNWDGTGVWIWDPTVPSFYNIPGSAGVNSPGAGGDQMMAWDGEKVIAFSWFEPNIATFMWDDSALAWVDITTGNEPADYLSGFTYDFANDKLVAFGGVPETDVGPNEHNQTWTWDRTVGTYGDWNLESPATSPSIRRKMYLTWDGTQVIGFGGVHSTGSSYASGPFTFYSDTWGWDGTNWTDLAPVTAPAARADAYLAYDGDAGAVMWAGYGAVNPIEATKTYTWDGTNWTQHTTTDNPGANNSNAGEWDGIQVFHYPIGSVAQRAAMKWDGVAFNWVPTFP